MSLIKMLYLIGTDHSDPRGHERLQKAIHIIKPCLVTIEIEEENFNNDVVKKAKHALRKGLRIARRYEHFEDEQYERMLKATDSYLFELSACLKLTRRMPVFPIDVGLGGGAVTTMESDEFYTTSMKYAKIYLDSGLAGNENTAKVLADYTACGLLSDEIIDKHFNDVYNMEQKEEDMIDLEELEERDAVMEGKIRFYYQQADGDVMNIGGLGHLFSEYNNLYERLKDLKPIRHKLNEFD